MNQGILFPILLLATAALCFLAGRLSQAPATLPAAGSGAIQPASARQDRPSPIPTTVAAAVPASAPDPAPPRRVTRQALPAAELMPTADPEARCILSGVLIDADGQLVRGASLRALTRFGEGRHTAEIRFIETDMAGRFALTLQGALPGNLPGTLHLEPGKPSRGIQVYKPPAVLVRTELPHPLRRGEVDLGTLQLQARPLVAAGRVVDLRGKPVSGAGLRFTVHYPGRSPSVQDARTAGDGSFRVYAEDELLQAQLRVQHPAHRHDKPFDLRPGAEDHHLVLEDAGELRVRFTCRTPGRPKVSLVAADGSRHKPKTSFHDRLGKRHTFVFRRVPLGSALLRYRVGEAPEQRRSLPVTKASQNPPAPPFEIEVG